MSLNYDLSVVRSTLGPEKWVTLTTSPDTQDKPEGEQKWHPITDALIWLSLAVDLGHIDEKNVDEWCFRIGLLHTLSGPRSGDVTFNARSFRINRNDIVNHVGLTTNVATRSRAAWLARLFKNGSTDERAVAIKQTQEPSAAEQVNAAWAVCEAEKAAGHPRA